MPVYQVRAVTAPYADWDRVELPYQRVFAHIRNAVLPE